MLPRYRKTNTRVCIYETQVGIALVVKERMYKMKPTCCLCLVGITLKRRGFVEGAVGRPRSSCDRKSEQCILERYPGEHLIISKPKNTMNLRSDNTLKRDKNGKNKSLELHPYTRLSWLKMVSWIHSHLVWGRVFFQCGVILVLAGKEIATC